MDEKLAARELSAEQLQFGGLWLFLSPEQLQFGRLWRFLSLTGNTYHEGPQSLSFLSLEYSQAEILFKIKDTQAVAPSLKFFVPCAQGDLCGDLIFRGRNQFLDQSFTLSRTKSGG